MFVVVTTDSFLNSVSQPEMLLSPTQKRQPEGLVLMPKLRF